MDLARNSDPGDEENSYSSLESFLTSLGTMNALPSTRTTLEGSVSAINRTDEGIRDMDEEYAHMLMELENSIEQLERTLPSLRINTDLSSNSLLVPEATRRPEFTSDLQRDHSDSPHTDFDDSLYESSSSSHSPTTSWILGTGMISRRMADSMISGNGNGERGMGDSFDEGSFHGANEVWSERDIGGPDILIKCPADFVQATDISDSENETSEGSDTSGSSGIGIDDLCTDRVREDQIKIAAAVTLAVLALLWAFEHQ